jgi:hypothetical protein
MTKFLGVATLWVCLISLPHVTAPPQDGVVAAVNSAVADDPGDPFRLAVSPARANAATPDEPAAKPLARLHFKNDLDKTLTLVEAELTMDGKPLPVVSNLKQGGEVILFSGTLPAGQHVIRTRMLCQGNRRGGGVFTYMDRYRFNVASEEVLTMPEDRSVLFTVIAQRNKGLNVPFERQIVIKADASDLPDSGGPRSLRN